MALTFFLISAALLFAYFRLLPGSHWIERIESLQESSNILYMFSAVVAAAAGILLTGVIVTAPLLSLALHQSYDSLFGLMDRLSDRQGDERVRRIEAQLVSRLRLQLKWYRFFNPIYLSIWVASIAFLAIIAIRLLAIPAIDKEAFANAMIFFSLSAVLCVLFATVSVFFFIAIKPGITKLKAHISYFEAMDGDRFGEVSNRQFIRWALPTAMVFIVVVGMIWAGSAFRGSPRPSVSISVNTTAVASTPVLVAADASLRHRSEVDVHLVPAPSGKYALDQLLAGDVDAATVAETPVILNSVAKPNLRIIMTISEAQYRLVARHSKGITTLAHFRGKTIGTVQNASPHFYLSRMLETVGIRDTDVTLVNLSAPDLVTTLKRGDVDAISIWEPYAEWAIEQLGDDAVVFENRSLYSERFNIVTTADILADSAKRDAIERLLVAVKDATDHVRRDPEAVIPVVAAEIGLLPSALRAVWNRFVFPAGLSPDFADQLGAVETWAAQIQGRKPRSRSDLQPLIDGQLLKQIE